MKRVCVFRAAFGQIKKPRHSAGDVFIEGLLSFVYDGLGLPDGQIKFFCKWFKTNAIQKPTLKDGTITLCMSADDPLVYDGFKFAAGEAVEVHLFDLTRPVPWHILHLR